MEKHGETGEHSICRRLSTLHRLTRQQRSSLTFHGIIYESTPCSWNSEKISLVSLNFTRCAREIRQKLREIFFRIPLTWSWLVVSIVQFTIISCNLHTVQFTITIRVLEFYGMVSLFLKSIQPRTYVHHPSSRVHHNLLSSSFSPSRFTNSFPRKE